MVFHFLESGTSVWLRLTVSVYIAVFLAMLSLHLVKKYLSFHEVFALEPLKTIAVFMIMPQFSATCMCFAGSVKGQGVGFIQGPFSPVYKGCNTESGTVRSCGIFEMSRH